VIVKKKGKKFKKSCLQKNLASQVAENVVIRANRTPARLASLVNLVDRIVSGVRHTPNVDLRRAHVASVMDQRPFQNRLNHWDCQL
jgi:hypothetical protein